jgi:hypothetical protein
MTIGNKIELRLSNVDPPAPEPKRTIYRDIVNLPSTVKLGLTIRYFNYDDVDLYFQITGSATGYTFGTVNLGLLASGTDAYINLDEFASRAKPSTSDLPNGEMEENITLILRGYTDSGYTNLKWTFERVVTVHWINSADAAWTVDVLNNFDDGTVQGWSLVNEAGGATPELIVSTDYVLSAPYSLRATYSQTSAWQEMRDRIEKALVTPAKDKIFAIADIRLFTDSLYNHAWAALKYAEILEDSVVLIFLGRPFTADLTEFLPRNKWMRLVVPLPKSTSLTFKIVLDAYVYGTTEYAGFIRTWLDDFKIISK